jgi:hypothetical protein
MGKSPAPQNVKHRIIIWPRILLLGIFLGVIKTGQHKNCTQIFLAASFIIAKVVETTQISIKCWINIWNIMNSYGRILCCHKNEWSIGTCYNMDKSWKIMLSERS